VGVVDPREPRARRCPARGGAQPSSEVEFRPRGRPALERDGVLPEGAHCPRTRWIFTGGGAQPSSEAEFRQYGVVPLKRSRVSFEVCWDRPLGGPLRLPGLWAPVTML
jgi:hypothetical protein